MALKRSPLVKKTGSKSSWVRPDARTFQKAWGLFVFSCFFAILFNAFYSDGIELKRSPSPSKGIQGTVKATPGTAVYPGWKDPAPKTPQPKRTPTPSTADPIVRLSHMGAKNRFDAKTALFLDARKPESYTAGHIPGALNFYPMEMEKFAPRVMPQLTDKGREIVVYCDGGDCTLSLELARALIQQGYQRVEVFEGGWPDWKKAGYPVGAGGTP